MAPSLTRARSLALIATAIAAVPRSANAQAVAPIRFASAPGADSYMLPFYAYEMGFFKKAGVTVEMHQFANAGTIATALAGNAVDVGHIDPIVVANAFNRGVDWTFFGGGGLYSGDAPTTVLCTLPNSPLRSAKDLEGKAVGVNALASISALGVKSWLESNGADLSKIKLFELPFGSMVPALTRGDLAAAFIAEPVLSQIKKDVRVMANAYDGIAKSFFICATFSSKAWLAQNTPVAHKIVQALEETTRWANTHRDDSAPILSKESGLSLEAVRATTRVRYADLDTKYIQPVLDAAYHYKAIEKPVSALDIIAKV
jgi:NitT/TauT family transport system substrate-binding protein